MSYINTAMSAAGDADDDSLSGLQFDGSAGPDYIMICLRGCSIDKCVFRLSLFPGLFERALYRDRFEDLIEPIQRFRGSVGFIVGVG